MPHLPPAAALAGALSKVPVRVLSAVCCQVAAGERQMPFEVLIAMVGRRVGAQTDRVEVSDRAGVPTDLARIV